jgi:hypothetical protein
MRTFVQDSGLSLFGYHEYVPHDRMTDEGEEGMVRHMCPMWDNFAYLHCKERGWS